MRRLADEHFAGGGRLLQARRDIDGVAGHEGLLGRAGDDLAGVHADPCRERDAVLALELLVEELERHAHVGGGAHRSERVVLVHERDPEHCHHRVADELLDGSPMAFDRGLHLVEVARHHPAERLGVEPLTERRRARHVAEDDRDGLALLAGGGRRRERCARTPCRTQPRPDSHGRSSSKYARGGAYAGPRSQASVGRPFAALNNLVPSWAWHFGAPAAIQEAASWAKPSPQRLTRRAANRVS